MSFLSHCQESFWIFVKRVWWNSNITIMLLKSFCILITCLLDDVWLLLGEIGSWSLSCLGKIKLRFTWLLFMPLTTNCFPFYFQPFKFLLSSLFRCCYAFTLIIHLLFSFCHLIFFNKYTQIFPCPFCFVF